MLSGKTTRLLFFFWSYMCVTSSNTVVTNLQRSTDGYVLVRAHHCEAEIEVDKAHRLKKKKEPWALAPCIAPLIWTLKAERRQLFLRFSFLLLFMFGIMYRNLPDMDSCIVSAYNNSIKHSPYVWSSVSACSLHTIASSLSSSPLALSPTPLLSLPTYDEPRGQEHRKCSGLTSWNHWQK